MADSQSTRPKSPLLLAAMVFNILALVLHICFELMNYFATESISEGAIEVISTIWALMVLAVVGVTILAIVLWVQNPTVNKRQAIITVAAGLLPLTMFLEALLR